MRIRHVIAVACVAFLRERRLIARCALALLGTLVTGASTAWSQSVASTDLKTWVAQVTAGHASVPKVAGLINRMIFAAPIAAGKTPRAINPPASVGPPGGVRIASAKDVNFSLHLNLTNRTMTRVQILKHLLQLANADLIIEVPDDGSPWRLTANDGQESRSCAAPTAASRLATARPEWVRCLGYDAVVVDVRGDMLLAASYPQAPAPGTQGLLLKDVRAQFLPSDTTSGEGLVEVRQAMGRFVLLKTLTPRTEPLRPGVKVGFESNMGRSSAPK